MSHWRVTNSVVVLINIYIYYYYYDSGRSGLPHGWRQAKENAAGSCRRHFAGGLWVMVTVCRPWPPGRTAPGGP